MSTTRPSDGKNDPYGTLGVAKTATEADIKTAYRKAAMKYHPDRNNGFEWAKRAFQEVQAAYDILSDAGRRAAFDRRTADNAHGRHEEAGRAKPAGTAGDEQRRFTKQAKRDRKALLGGRYQIKLTFLEALFGGICTIELEDGGSLLVEIDADTRSGDTFSVKTPAWWTGRPRVLDFKISVQRHETFRRSGDDIIARMSITLRQAVLGGRAKVPTIYGRVSVDLKPRLGGSGIFRIPGYGVDGGDQVVEYYVDFPSTREPELEAFLRDWQPRHDGY